MSLFIFNKHALEFIRPSSPSVYYSHNPKGIKLMTRLRFVLVNYVSMNLYTFSKIRLIFYVTMVSNFNSSVFFLLNCPLFTNERSNLFGVSSLKIPTPFWRIFSFLVQRLSIQLRMRQFLMRPWNLFYQLRDFKCHFI